MNILYILAYCTTNDGESINKKVKSVKKEKITRLKLADIHEFFNDLNKSQIHDMEQAIRQCGDYELSRAYSHLAIRPDTWFSLSEHARQNKLNSFFKVLPVRSEEDTQNITKLISQRNEDKSKKQINKEL